MAKTTPNYFDAKVGKFGTMEADVMFGTTKASVSISKKGDLSVFFTESKERKYFKARENEYGTYFVVMLGKGEPMYLCSFGESKKDKKPYFRAQAGEVQNLEFSDEEGAAPKAPAQYGAR